MKPLVLFSLLVLGLFFNSYSFAAASETDAHKKFVPEEYDPKDFLIDTQVLRKDAASIKIIQVKRINKADQLPHACRAWLEVTVNDRPIFVRYFDDIDPAGFSYGVMIPKEQPSKQWLLLVKNGDYDGRLFLIGPDGKTFDYTGGSFFVSPDQKFLFSVYESDASGLTVIDLNDGQAVFSTKDNPYPVYAYYSDGKDVFFTEETDRDAYGGGRVNEKTGAIYKYDQQKGFVKLDIDKKDIPGLREISYLFDPRKYADCTSKQVGMMINLQQQHHFPH